MMKVLGYDISGRTLRVGDICVTTGKPGHPFCGKVCKVSGEPFPEGRSDGNIVIESDGRKYAFYDQNLRKLYNDHRYPDESLSDLTADPSIKIEAST